MKDLNPILSNTLEVLYSNRSDGNVINALTELNYNILRTIREYQVHKVPEEYITVLEQIRITIVCIQEKSLDVFKAQGEDILATYFNFSDKF